MAPSALANPAKLAADPGQEPAAAHDPADYAGRSKYGGLAPTTRVKGENAVGVAVAVKDLVKVTQRVRANHEPIT
jgi:hypothetical protein